MIIMGIDPGLATIGWGVVDYRSGRFITLAMGAILTEAHTPVQDRLLTIHEELKSLIELYHPTEIAVEELFFTKNITTGIPVAEARGVILLTARQKGINVCEYTPMQVKQAVTGYGRADKKQVIEMTRIILNLHSAPKPDDTADALAIAICHAHTGSSRLRSFYNPDTPIGNR